MAPRGAICSLMMAAGDSCRSEWLVGVELGRLSIRHEVRTPGLLRLRTIRVPQRLTQHLQALEDRASALAAVTRTRADGAIALLWRAP